MRMKKASIGKLKQKIATKVSKSSNTRLKLAIIAILHLLHKRYIGVYIDPVLACNLRCKMCYFSDSQKVKEMKGSLSREEIEALAHSLFDHALRLQIGCGAEPTLSKETLHLIELGKTHQVPFISLITNGNLLSYEDVENYARAGLNELTLSLHGTTRDTYEYLMERGSFDKFIHLLEHAHKVKKLYPSLQIRINYTLNEDNLADLALLPQLIAPYAIDKVQIRPVQKIGDSAYSNFSMKQLIDNYETIIIPVQEQLTNRGITLLCPSKKKMSITQRPPRKLDMLFEEFTYYYLSPKSLDKADIDFRTTPFSTYASQKKVLLQIVKAIATPNNKYQEKGAYTTKKLNY
ncbi:radical SAM protein [Porphyromonas circumdentaria]|uniref:Radical SAM superfamily protein n=1 Tax=Porphyromonas circumdentaria TaxID=29524 RepID=A0A1T4Q309_9PORP|nr:radical SAM protein [Porphyromonas circumdentaria]MBB6276602.1 sulfatase maturation enzyme AslB (radical SAM superfamily) [Porphyromonas circumdentaria]SJZ97917.1 Radical SAM superfamily protein [Porphyromonas circumdentaria]